MNLTADEAETLYNELIKHHLTPISIEELEATRSRMRQIEHRHATAFDLYLSTIVDIINTLSLPWNMSFEIISNMAAIRVRGTLIKMGVDINQPPNAAAQAVIDKVSEALLPGQLTILKGFSDQEKFGKSFAAINRQGAVLFYGAVENFLLTSIEIELEHDSVKLKKVANKRRNDLSSASVPLEVLMECGSDCSIAHLVMETIRPKLNSIITITSLCRDVFGQKFSETMESRQRDGLMLFHLRNLIAHRGGVVDRKFLEDTKEIAPGAFALSEHVSIGHPALLGFLNYAISSMVAIGESTGIDARPASWRRDGTRPST